MMANQETKRRSGSRREQEHAEMLEAMPSSSTKNIE